MDSYIENLRTRKREMLISERKQARDVLQSNQRKELGTIHRSHSTDDVTKIAFKLKTRKQLDMSDLTNLKNSLIESEETISKFCEEVGSVHGLVKLLINIGSSGSQLEAAGCCCNLSLGTEKACSLVAAIAGPYLLTFLHSSDVHLAETCAWTLGNLAAGGVADVMKRQGATGRLPGLLAHHDERLRSAAAYALAHMHIHDPLRTTELMAIAELLLDNEMESSDTLWLLYVISHEETLQSILQTEAAFSKIFYTLHGLVIRGCDGFSVQIVCLIRIAANLLTNQFQISLFNDSSFWEKFSNTATALLGHLCDGIRRESLWLIANIYNFTPNSESKKLFFKHISSLIDCSLPCLLKNNIYDSVLI